MLKVSENIIIEVQNILVLKKLLSFYIQKMLLWLIFNIQGYLELGGTTTMHLKSTKFCSLGRLVFLFIWSTTWYTIAT